MRFHIRDAYVYNNCLYFIPIEVDSIYKYNLDEKKMNRVKELSLKYKNNLFSKCLDIDGLIFFIPNEAEDMISFDIKTNRINKYMIMKANNARYVNAYRIDDEIVLLPCYLDTDVIRFDINNNSFRKFKLVNDTGNQYKNNFVTLYYRINNWVYFFVNRVKHIFAYNLDDNECREYYCDRLDGNPVDVCSADTYSIVINDNGKAYLIDDNKFITIKFDSATIIDKEFKMFLYNNKIYLFVMSEHANIYRYNVERCVFEKSEQEVPSEFRRTYNKYWMWKNAFSREYDGKLYIFSAAGNGFLVLDEEKCVLVCMEIDIKNMSFEYEYFESIMKKKFNEKSVMLEKENQDLTTYLEFI